MLENRWDEIWIKGIIALSSTDKMLTTQPSVLIGLPAGLSGSVQQSIAFFDQDLQENDGN